MTESELDRICVVLVRTRNVLNLGAAARAMSNFGITRLRVVRPYEVAFREARSAVGAGEVLAQAAEFARVEDAIADSTLAVGTTAVGDREVQQPLTGLLDGARLIRERLAGDAGGRVALLFGSEKTGLTKEEMSHCHFLMRIPTRTEHRSMNLGQSVAVCLYELVRETRAVLTPQREGAAATAGELERMTAVWNEALLLSGYTEPGSAAATELKVRRLARRLALNAEDAELWLGMLRKMLWKMRGKG